MGQLENRKVVQHNDLIQGVSKMDAVPLKIFELCVSAIDTKNPPQNNTIYLSKSELFDFFDVSDTNKYTRFHQSIKKLQEQSILQIQELNDKGKIKYKSIVPIPYVDWNNYNDEVTIRFDIEIMPYLIGLKENFTQYLITDIRKLNSKYSIILYKWLTMNYNQYEKYSNSKCKNPYIDINDLRKITDTENEYEIMSNFTRRILEEPLNDINENTHYYIEYKKIKRGRSIVGIQFYIESKTEQRKIPYDKTLYGKTNKEIQDDKNMILLPIALQNTYINSLVAKKIIKMSDVQDIVNIYVQIVPIYERIDNEWISTQYGTKKDVIERHLARLSQYMINEIEEHKKNTVAYLKKAIIDYEWKLDNRVVEFTEKILK